MAHELPGSKGDAIRAGGHADFMAHQQGLKSKAAATKRITEFEESFVDPATGKVKVNIDPGRTHPVSRNIPATKDKNLLSRARQNELKEGKRLLRAAAEGRLPSSPRTVMAAAAAGAQTGLNNDVKRFLLDFLSKSAGLPLIRKQARQKRNKFDAPPPMPKYTASPEFRGLPHPEGPAPQPLSFRGGQSVPKSGVREFPKTLPPKMSLGKAIKMAKGNLPLLLLLLAGGALGGVAMGDRDAA